MGSLVLTVLIFYLALPVAGAWRTRRSWARFRAAARSALGRPEVDYSHLQPESHPDAPPTRLTGTLEAFEGADRLWIGNDRVSAAVSLANVPVYFLDEAPEPFGIGVDPPRKAEASSLGALPEGTQFLVSGPLVHDNHGRVLFSAAPGEDLLVLAFEGDRDTVLPRAIHGGRAAVDLWNSWTPVSLGLGVLVLLVLAYLNLRSWGDPASAAEALALALLPATFFLPPGILFFYAFARLWARGRDLRSRADGEGNRRRRGRAHRQALAWEAGSYLCLGTGALVNGALLLVLLRLWIH